MTDADGLIVSALLHGASLLLIIAGYHVTREMIRRPAALLAVLAAGLGSVLLVRHAPAGPVWTPEAWSGAQAGGRPLRLHAPMRQATLADEAGRPAPTGPLQIRGPRETTAASESAQASANAHEGGEDRAGPAHPSSVLASLLLPHPARPLRALDIIQDCPYCPEMVVVPAGSSVMGAANDDPEANEAERPLRSIRFWPGYAIGRYEITTDEYRQFAMATGRSMPGCDVGGETGTPAPGRLPITCISPLDAAAFAGWLRRLTGVPFRLPTAVEWEYAARAGHDVVEARRGVRADRPVRVEATAANAWNIHGMSGNVAEIVASCWQASLAAPAADIEQGCGLRMIKDGGANEEARWQRPSARRPIRSSDSEANIGFRVARDLR